ncbi:MAG: pilus assembly protein, partial [Anaerolineales bacterium]|nr:pilus assembly protein [Anaerolineales bacterium]
MWKRYVPSNTSVKRFWRGESRSQGMVEFAIAAPILLMLIFGIIDFSLLFSAWLLTQNIARQAVRYAVTGVYDLAHCPPGGCVTQAQEDAARLASIHQEARRYLSGLLLDPDAEQNEPGYLKITVCTSAPYITILPKMGSNQYGDCLPREHPGEPGRPVIVMVDFNHPYITPILNEVWPMVHLASYQEGIVEQFRLSRLINLPPNLQLPTSTPLPPTNTFTPTQTFTATETFTATPTLLPLYLEIISPYMDGLGYNEVSLTTFQAVAYDPNVGMYDGAGIERVTFSFSGPGVIPNSVEYQAAYCAFGGNGPCNPMNSAVFNALPNSNLYNTANDYYMTVTAYALDGRTVTAVRRFKILKPPTNTPTPTNTSTSTLTSTFTFTQTPSFTPTRTFTPTNTFTATPTRTWTNTHTWTNTRTPSLTFTITNTPTITYTPTVSFTPTRTFTSTNTVPTPTFTPSRTFTHTFTRTNTVPTPTFAPSRTFTNTFTRTNT